MRKVALAAGIAIAAFCLALVAPPFRHAVAEAIAQAIGATGSSAPALALQVGGSDGANLQSFKMGSAANSAAAVTGNLSHVVAGPGEKAVASQPAVTTAASASVVAGGAGVRHVARGCSAFVSTVAAQPDIIVNLRDGATGAGTIIWSGRVSCAITSGNACAVTSPPLNIVGSAATAMTCETATAPAATNFATANLTYYDAN